MKKSKACLSLLTLLAFGILAGCSATSTKSADVSGSIRKSLDQAGLKDVSASQDRDKGVVILGGEVGMDSDKAEAETIAKSIAGGQVVSNQIAVVQRGAGHMGDQNRRGMGEPGAKHMGDHGPGRMPEPHR